MAQDLENLRDEGAKSVEETQRELEKLESKARDAAAQTRETKERVTQLLANHRSRQEMRARTRDSKEMEVRRRSDPPISTSHSSGADQARRDCARERVVATRS